MCGLNNLQQSRSLSFQGERTQWVTRDVAVRGGHQPSVYVDCISALVCSGALQRSRISMAQLKPMSRTADIRIGTAGWSIPRAAAFRFDSTGTHLERYARSLRCAEINSSFHRPRASDLREVA